MSTSNRTTTTTTTTTTTNKSQSDLFVFPDRDDLSSLFYAPIRSTMNKDAHYTHVHMQQARDADLFEDFCKDKLPADDIYVPPHLQPINPEDEDDVVPDQHAAFGIQKATQKVREPAWKDLGLGELMRQGPGGAAGYGSGSGGGAGEGKSSGAPRRKGAGREYRGMPR
ncbi:Apc13p protein-domain-containing protein [Lasiosphaeria hispida]|uniref:Apc13p protein-domain-containing protein n=1 Tax=Lasiosphaeria hispida TaxID=260671 RepID=A0AAJ0HPN4_9PEZI|nr:Apc13p protein-domain-containing protein [Lasiosphaeria hispida]